jgi:hypothetical protein
MPPPLNQEVIKGMHPKNPQQEAAAHPPLYAVSVDAGSAAIKAVGYESAGLFLGDVQVTGTISASELNLTQADVAEDFDLRTDAPAPPGTVVVLDGEGVVRPSHEPYDHRVAGVVSGAGTYQPAVVLDRRESGTDRAPVALFGKVFCRVDATGAPIGIGDLLTTSSVAGHAMKATDRARMAGAIVGKALAPLATGRALVPVLVVLQ